MTDSNATRPEVMPNDSMCGGLYPVHGSVTHGRTVECCDFCGLPADYEPARTAAEASAKAEIAELRQMLERVVTALPVLETMLAVAGLNAGLAVVQELGADARALLARQAGEGA